MYLMACTMVMLVGIYQWLRGFIAASDIHAGPKHLHGFARLYLIPAFLMLAPFFASMFDEV